LRRALAPLPVDGPVRVRLSPADLAALGETTSSDGHLLELVPDDSLAAGDAIAEREGAMVDARISAALTRARAVVTG
jgi:flagellar assembly protein FliH